jgi:hypothetical protein
MSQEDNPNRQSSHSQKRTFPLHNQSIQKLHQQYCKYQDYTDNRHSWHTRTVHLYMEEEGCKHCLRVEIATERQGRVKASKFGVNDRHVGKVGGHSARKSKVLWYHKNGLKRCNTDVSRFSDLVFEFGYFQSLLVLFNIDFIRDLLSNGNLLFHLQRITVSCLELFR